MKDASHKAMLSEVTAIVKRIAQSNAPGNRRDHRAFWSLVDHDERRITQSNALGGHRDNQAVQVLLKNDEGRKWIMFDSSEWSLFCEMVLYVHNMFAGYTCNVSVAELCFNKVFECHRTMMSGKSPFSSIEREFWRYHDREVDGWNGWQAEKCFLHYMPWLSMSW
jgi:hypothetical protein